MSKVWVRIDMINGESYIGSIDNFYDEDEDLFLFLEEQAYLGLKLDNVHRCKEVDGKILLEPLDNRNSIYRDSLIIMNTDNIYTLKFLKEDSDLVKRLKIKADEKQKPLKDAKNVLRFKPIKKEKI